MAIVTAQSNAPCSHHRHLDTHLHEAGVHGSCGADHVDVRSRCGADALQWGIGRGRKGEVLWVPGTLATGADREKPVKSLQKEVESKEGPTSSP